MHLSDASPVIWTWRLWCDSDVTVWTCFRKQNLEEEDPMTGKVKSEGICRDRCSFKAVAMLLNTCLPLNKTTTTTQLPQASLPRFWFCNPGTRNLYILACFKMALMLHLDRFSWRARGSWCENIEVGARPGLAIERVGNTTEPPISELQGPEETIEITSSSRKQSPEVVKPEHFGCS